MKIPADLHLLRPVSSRKRWEEERSRWVRVRESEVRERKRGRKWIGPASLVFYRRLDRSGSYPVHSLPIPAVRSCFDPYGSIWRLLNLTFDPDRLDFALGPLFGAVYAFTWFSCYFLHCILFFTPLPCLICFRKFYKNL